MDRQWNCEVEIGLTEGCSDDKNGKYCLLAAIIRVHAVSARRECNCTSKESFMCSLVW